VQFSLSARYCITYAH